MAVALPSGEVLVTGGGGSTPLASSELYDPATDSWRSTATMIVARDGGTATLLGSGSVLVLGGNSSPGQCALGELYIPLLSPSMAVSSTGPDTSMPTWSWTSSGGGDGTFRWKLDDADLDHGSSIGTALSYTPSTPLADGLHVLYVAERGIGQDDGMPAWSRSRATSFTVSTAGPGPGPGPEPTQSQPASEGHCGSGAAVSLFLLILGCVRFTSLPRSSASVQPNRTARTPVGHEG